MFNRKQGSLQTIVEKNNRRALLIVGATHGDEPAGIIGDSCSELALIQGQIYAYDTVMGEHCAPCDSFMMLPSKHPDENDWDAGFLCIKV